METIKFEKGKSYGNWTNSAELYITKRTRCYAWLGAAKRKITCVTLDGENVERVELTDGVFAYACCEAFRKPATYETKSNIGTKSDYARAIYRDGYLVGEIGYSDITGCTSWYFRAPNGLRVSEDFDDATVTAEDIIEKIKKAHGEVKCAYTDWQTEEAAARGFSINDLAYVEPMFSTEDCRRYFGWSSEAESWVACGEGEEAFFDDFYDALHYAMRRPRTAYGCEYDESLGYEAFLTSDGSGELKTWEAGTLEEIIDQTSDFDFDYYPECGLRAVISVFPCDESYEGDVLYEISAEYVYETGTYKVAKYAYRFED